MEFNEYLKLFKIILILNINIFFIEITYTIHKLAGWQSGHAAACKAVYAGSIPASASNIY